MATRDTARTSQRFGITNPRRQLPPRTGLTWSAKERVRATGRSPNADSKSGASVRRNRRENRCPPANSSDGPNTAQSGATTDDGAWPGSLGLAARATVDPTASPTPLGLDRETMTALRTACANDAAAAAGLHANQKTMGALATHDRRLISAFHLLPQESAKNLKLNQFFGLFVNSRRAVHGRRDPTRAPESVPAGCG